MSVDEQQSSFDGAKQDIQDKCIFISNLFQEIEESKIKKDEPEIDQNQPEINDSDMVMQYSISDLNDLPHHKEKTNISFKANESLEDIQDIEFPLKIVANEESLKDFDIIGMLKEVNNVLNKENHDFKLKDLFDVFAESIKGTKAEPKFNQIGINGAETDEKFQDTFQTFLSKFGYSPITKTVKPFHEGIPCSVCWRASIIGVRYKCSECEWFNLCEV